MKVALCPHLSVEHYRGGEKWTASLANRLAADGVDVAVRALPYAPDGTRRVDAEDVLDDGVAYREAWRHDLSGFDVAYVFYNPLSRAFFGGDVYRIAGIHSWVYASDRLYEPHYGVVPHGVKALYRAVGDRELLGFDAVHTCTPTFESPHPHTVHVPNPVDADLFHPDAAATAGEFTVLVTAARIPEKGWDTVREVAPALRDRGIRVVATGGEDGDGGRGRAGTGDRGRGDERDDGGEEAVEDLGFLSEADLAAWYARAHVALHPARVDTDSMVVNEACAAGTPGVTTSIPTHAVHEDESAILFADSPREVIDGIDHLRREWRTADGYRERTDSARAIGERRDADRVYPELKALVTRER